MCRCILWWDALGDSTTRSCSTSNFSVLRYIPTDFHSDYPSLDPHTHTNSPWGFPPPHTLPAFTVICFLDGCYSDWGEWNLKIVLICISLMAQDISLSLCFVKITTHPSTKASRQECTDSMPTALYVHSTIQSVTCSHLWEVHSKTAEAPWDHREHPTLCLLWMRYSFQNIRVWFSNVNSAWWKVLLVIFCCCNKTLYQKLLREQRVCLGVYDSKNYILSCQVRPWHGNRKAADHIFAHMHMKQRGRTGRMARLWTSKTIPWHTSTKSPSSQTVPPPGDQVFKYVSL